MLGKRNIEHYGNPVYKRLMSDLCQQKADLFTALATGLSPEGCGILADKSGFSRPLPKSESSSGYFQRMTLKLSGSPLFIPDGLQQFREAVQIAAFEHSRNHDISRSACAINVYQSELQTGQFSVFGGLHIDTDVERAMRGKQAPIDLFLISDHTDLTTAFYDQPIALDADRLRHTMPELMFRSFQQELESRLEGAKPVCGQAYELVRSSELHVHEARCPDKGSARRTFVAIAFTEQMPMSMINGNPELRHWVEANQPDPVLVAQQQMQI